MSDTSNLTELARFVGQSELACEVASRRAVNDIARRLAPPPQRQRVTDLLAAVLSLSARTRRMTMPRAVVELDVFFPNGGRAVRMMLPAEG